MALQKHHAAWLAAHPDKTPEWLQAVLSMGFHVHHIDGNYVNNAADNLVLIEGVDHLRLHNSPGSLRTKLRSKTELAIERRASAGAVAYDAVARGAEWRHMPMVCGYSVKLAKSAARRHAEIHHKPWPPVVIEAWTKLKRRHTRRSAIAAEQTNTLKRLL